MRTRRPLPSAEPPRPGLSRREVLGGGLAALAGLAGCDRFDATTWFSRGKYDVDRRFSESTQELGPPPPPQLADDRRYSALVVSDLHFWQEEVNHSIAEIAAYLEAHPVDLLFQLGDFADAGYPGEYDTGLRALETLEVPCYSAIGNHDVWNEGWPHFRLHFGPSVYALRLGAVRFIVLDLAGATLGGLQRPWLEEQLAAARADGGTDPSPIVLLGHYPLWTTNELGFGQMGSEQEVYDILDLMRRYDVTAHLSGHTHRWAHTALDEVRLYTVSAVKEASPNRCGLRLDVDGDELTFTRVPFPFAEEG